MCSRVKSLRREMCSLLIDAAHKTLVSKMMTKVPLIAVVALHFYFLLCYCAVLPLVRNTLSRFRSKL